jgi:hypothetical protein
MIERRTFFVGLSFSFTWAVPKGNVRHRNNILSSWLVQGAFCNFTHLGIMMVYLYKAELEEKV